MHTIVECRGINNSLEATNNIILRELARGAGDIRRDGLKIGIQVTRDCALVSQSGVSMR